MSLLSKNPPYIITPVLRECFEQIRERFAQRQSLSFPVKDQPFLIKVAASDTFLVGCIFQHVHGEPNITTMVNHRLTQTAMSKSSDYKNYHALYCTLKRYQVLLTENIIILEYRFASLLKKMSDLVPVNAMIAKMYLFINSFNIYCTAEADTRFEKLVKSLQSSAVLSLLQLEEKLASTFAVKSPDNEIAADYDEDSPIGFKAECCTLCSAVIQQIGGHSDGLASELLRQSLADVKLHQQGDPFCSKIRNKLQSNSHILGAFREQYVVQDEVLYRVTPEGNLLIIPNAIITHLINFYHQFYGHPGVSKTTVLIIAVRFITLI